MRWSWAVETVTGAALGELTEARSRKLVFDLRGPCSATFDVDGWSEAGLMLAELTTNLECWRDGQLIFRGRMGSTDDDLDTDRHNTAWSAVDYRGLLEGRIDEIGRYYDHWHQDDIGWNLITLAQSGAGGNLGITRGTSRAGPGPVGGRELTVDSGSPILNALDHFQNIRNGFEYWIDPQLRYQAATWRGVARDDFPIAWGTTATHIKRSYDTGKFANWVRVVGGKPEGAGQDEPEPYADRWAPDLATRVEGRIARVVTNSDLKEQSTIDAAAEQLLADSLNPPAAYTATLIPGLWQGPDHLWLGDTLPIYVRSGRLNLTTTGRVAQLDISIDDEGNETVDVTFGHVAPDWTPTSSTTRIGPRINRDTPIITTGALLERIDRLERAR